MMMLGVLAFTYGAILLVLGLLGLPVLRVSVVGLVILSLVGSALLWGETLALYPELRIALAGLCCLGLLALAPGSVARPGRHRVE